MSRVVVTLAVALVALFASSAEAQRRRAAWAPPIEPVLVSTSEGPASRHQVIVALRATGDAEVVQDERLFELEVTEVAAAAARRRPRTHRCRHPSAPRRLGPLVPMHAGDRFGAALDVRALCWGRALTALEAGGAVTVRYAGRGRAVVARGPAGETARELRAASPFALPVGEASEASPVISMNAVDARSARSIAFRVAIRGPEAATRRAWIRPDRVRFRVVDPAGRAHDCHLDRTGAAPIPDLFSRVSSRRASRLSLEARAYCEDALDRAGVYSVTPVLELDEDGSEWELNALTGTFVGATVALRVRSGEGALMRTLRDEDLRRYVP